MDLKVLSILSELIKIFEINILGKDMHWKEAVDFKDE